LYPSATVDYGDIHREVLHPCGAGDDEVALADTPHLGRRS
jgi:hypothetical protein